MTNIFVTVCVCVCVQCSAVHVASYVPIGIHTKDSRHKFHDTMAYLSSDPLHHKCALGLHINSGLKIFQSFNWSDGCSCYHIAMGWHKFLFVVDGRVSKKI